MFCPACRYKDTKVIDSRVGSDGTTIRRRRECPKCIFRFSTREESEILDLTVIKRNGDREGYRREKISSGLRRAFQKRPITEEEFEQLIHAIERDIQALRQREMKSETIGEIAMRHLALVDNVAYIRFASVYRQFEDVDRFRKEIALLGRPKKGRSQKKQKHTRHQKRKKS